MDLCRLTSRILKIAPRRSAGQEAGAQRMAAEIRSVEADAPGICLHDVGHACR
jgi:hypothetical protein